VIEFTPTEFRMLSQWISWGAVVAIALWLLGSAVFTIYVSKIWNYDKIYGSINAVVILQLWLYLSAYIILLGAELNAEIDRQASPKAP
jgi:membrane protein